MVSITQSVLQTPAKNSPKIILVIDDDPSILDLLADLLNEEGYIVLLASRGTEALAQAERLVPDVILADIWLPDLHGHEICARLQQNPHYATTPVILMSAHTTYVPKRCTYTAFVPKPFELHVLLDALQDALSEPGGELVRAVND